MSLMTYYCIGSTLLSILGILRLLKYPIGTVPAYEFKGVLFSSKDARNAYRHNVYIEQVAKECGVTPGVFKRYLSKSLNAHQAILQIEKDRQKVIDDSKD